MLLRPQNTKFKHKFIKYQKPLLRANLSYGDCGLLSLTGGMLNSKHIEAIRQSINKKLKRRGFIWFRIFPDFPVTIKPDSSRMGKGKGNISFWCTTIPAGCIFVELKSISKEISLNSLLAAVKRLPFKSRIVLKK